MALLQLSGMSECKRMSVKRSVMYSRMDTGACLRNSEGIRSHPWAFLGANRLIAVWTSWSSIAEGATVSVRKISLRAFLRGRRCRRSTGEDLETPA
eukprot:114234-Amphidinium_carterae.2